MVVAPGLLAFGEEEARQCLSGDRGLSTIEDPGRSWVILAQIDWRLHELLLHRLCHDWSRPRGGFPLALTPSLLASSLFVRSAQGDSPLPARGKKTPAAGGCAEEVPCDTSYARTRGGNREDKIETGRWGAWSAQCVPFLQPKRVPDHFDSAQSK